MIGYNPRAWYWRSDDGRLYSSGALSLADEASDEFVSWTNGGGIPTPWPRDDHGQQTQAALDAVLVAAGVRASPDPTITYKADLYRRMTDEEADRVEDALSNAPVRQRRLFEAAQYLDHAAPEFARMREALVGLFGEDRADVLLASS